MNTTIIIIVGILAAALIYFLVKRNLKDEKKFEQQLKDDYKKTEPAGPDQDAEQVQQ